MISGLLLSLLTYWYWQQFLLQTSIATSKRWFDTAFEVSQRACPDSWEVYNQIGESTHRCTLYYPLLTLSWHGVFSRTECDIGEHGEAIRSLGWQDPPPRDADFQVAGWSTATIALNPMHQDWEKSYYHVNTTRPRWCESYGVHTKPG